MARNTFSRTLHDLGLSAWFGGTLANAVALNAAAAEAGSSTDTGRVANAGWDRWTPVNAVAIGAHLVGAVGQLGANKERVAGQKGVGASTVAKLALTGAALGATAWSGTLGAKLAKYDGVVVEGGTDPAPETPGEVANAQRQLKVLQWVIPALTGGIAVLNALHGEQQRPNQQVPGILQGAAQLTGATD